MSGLLRACLAYAVVWLAAWTLAEALVNGVLP